jgi:ABC-type dipeptide/oligopeptide/nickel transport system permease subunit
MQPALEGALGPTAGNVVTLLLAIGVVSWLTLARVVRGQVLSLKGQPFVEAARAMGCSTPWILARHILPNLVSPIIVYTTLAVPQAILQESFLSFLGIGVQLPLPSWGNLVSEGLSELNPVKAHYWIPAWPNGLLALTLLALNFVGDGLRDRYDPRSRSQRS